MKPIQCLLFAVALSGAAVVITSCEKKENPIERAGDKIDDALDRRPGEKVRDAVEDAADDVKDAVR